jgi:8-amino-7-oxononanoate synthase
LAFAQENGAAVVATGTLSKSFGSQGGLVLGLPAVREHPVNRARPFIYDTGLAPAAAGAALAALQVLKAAPGLPEKVSDPAAPSPDPPCSSSSGP